MLHNWCLHRSEVNTTASPRRGFSVCYIDANTQLRPDLEDLSPEAAARRTQLAERVARGEHLRLWPQVFPEFLPANVERVNDAEFKLPETSEPPARL